MCVCVCVCVFERVCVLESARERSSIQTNTHTPQTHQPFAAAHARGRTEGESRCNRQSSSRREQYSAHGAPTHKFVFESTHANLKNRFLSQTDPKRDTKKDLMRPSHHSTPKSANEHFLGSSNPSGSSNARRVFFKKSRWSVFFVFLFFVLTCCKLGALDFIILLRFHSNRIIQTRIFLYVCTTLAAVAAAVAPAEPAAATPPPRRPPPPRPSPPWSPPPRPPPPRKRAAVAATRSRFGN